MLNLNNPNSFSETSSGSHDFMAPYTRVSYDEELAIETANKIGIALELPDEAGPEVLAAYLCTFDRTGIDYIDAEISALPLRFGIKNQPYTELPDSDAYEGPSTFQFISHNCPSSAPLGSVIYRSLRVQATGDLHPNSVGLTYEWQRIGESGIVKFIRMFRRSDNPVTYVPVPIKDNRQVTIPVKIHTPAKPGDYFLRVYGVGVSGQPSITLRIRIGDAPKGLDVNPGYSDYGADHTAALEMLGTYLDDKPEQTLLEVASGVHPHLLHFAARGHKVIASDVCSNQMQLGAIFKNYMLPETLQKNLSFASFDAFDSPYKPNQFDGVAMFAALHHFPDPVEFLKAIAKQLKPGGFIAVCCEPCDPLTLGEAYIQDLNAGINEQVFSVEEYRYMFQSAELEEVIVRNDNGSLKAILRSP